MEKRFERLYELYFRDVYRYVYIKTKNKWDTEDLVSETFRKAYEHAACRQAEHHPKAWLFAIARNTVIDHFRKKKGLLVGGRIEHFMADLIERDSLERRDDRESIMKILRQLPEDEAAILHLRYGKEMRFREIAFLLEMKEGCVRVKAGRILKKIRVLLKNEGERQV